MTSHPARDQARAQARAAADQARALRLESDRLWLAGDQAGARSLLDQARGFDEVCNAHCRTAAAILRTGPP